MSCLDFRSLPYLDNGSPSASTAMLAARDIRRCFDNFEEPSRYPIFSMVLISHFSFLIHNFFFFFVDFLFFFMIFPFTILIANSCYDYYTHILFAQSILSVFWLYLFIYNLAKCVYVKTFLDCILFVIHHESCRN